MLCVPCYVLLCHAHILEGLYDLISVESNRLLGIRIDSIRQNFSPPCAFIRDLTSGKSSSAKRTSGESEVFDPRADSNRLCFKTIRLSLGVLDMSDPVISPERRSNMPSLLAFTHPYSFVPVTSNKPFL